MKCYRCGSFLYESEYCTSCGADVSVYKKIVKKSNEMYNKGLDYARARNLTRAVEYLEISLKMYKGNISARNLLGLVYVEMGEYARGLAQWVVSKSMQSDNELADYFLDKLQNNQSYISKMQSAIKKYNRSLTYVQEGNYDLAEVQLRKLLNDNHNFVKGYQLYALLLIRDKKFDEAEATLVKAQKIDKGNPTTISYMSYVDSMIAEEEKQLSSSEVKSRRKARKAMEEENKPMSGDDVIIPKSSYKENSPAAITVVQILIGILIGAAIVFFIVTPARVKSVTSENTQEVAAYESEIAELEAQIEELSGESETDTGTLEQYQALLEAYGAYSNQEYAQSLTYLESVTQASEIGGTFLDVYNMILSDESDEQAQALVEDAYDSYIVWGDYWYGLTLVEEAAEISPYNEYVLFYEGLCYQGQGDNEEAITYLKSYIERYPSGTFAEDATYYAGLCYYEEGQTDEASTYFSSYIESYPEGTYAEEVQEMLNYLNA